MNPTRRAIAAVALLAAAISSCAAFFFYRTGALLYFGDAESHLNTARRVFDSITPGVDQFGSPWLPLPHLLLMPFVRSDALWRTGLAGCISSGACFVVAAVFLFAATRRVFRSELPAVAAVAVFVLNPNNLYLQSTPMTEPVFFLALCGLLYFTVRFVEIPTAGPALGAGVTILAATLTRYEGWFLIPFVGLFLLVHARDRRWRILFLFGSVAAAGPLVWLFYNWWLSGNPLLFYNGPYSATAIQGGTPYPGKGDWPLAALYYLTACRLVTGVPLLIMGTIGVLAALWRRLFWPVLFLTLPPAFYIWSVHSSGTYIHVPPL